MSPLFSALLLATSVLGLAVRDEPKDGALWTYSGCTNEIPGMPRTLGGPSKSGNMTVDICTSFCYGKDYSHAGLEYGNE